MVWGSWGSGGSTGSWGSGGFGHSGGRSKHRTPNGQHIHSCSVHHIHGFGSHGHEHNGFFGSHYREHCPGCRRDRSFGGLGGSHSGVGVFVSLFFGGKLAKKSLWD